MPLFIVKAEEVSMKKIFFLGIFLFFAGFNLREVVAAPFVLRDEATGQNYRCSLSGQGGGTAVDPKCIDSISALCRTNTSFGRDSCFDKASTACRAGATVECVNQTAASCRVNTSLGKDACFDRATNACSGNGLAIIELMNGARAQIIENSESRLDN